MRADTLQVPLRPQESFASTCEKSQLIDEDNLYRLHFLDNEHRIYTAESNLGPLLMALMREEESSQWRVILVSREGIEHKIIPMSEMTSDSPSDFIYHMRKKIFIGMPDLNKSPPFIEIANFLDSKFNEEELKQLIGTIKWKTGNDSASSSTDALRTEQREDISIATQKGKSTATQTRALVDKNGNPKFTGFSNKNSADNNATVSIELSELNSKELIIR